MIQLANVHRRFAAVVAVEDVTLEIPAGQVVGILGPNGAGKTTTMRMIAGALPPSAGRVTVGNLDTLDDSVAVRALLGYLPENNPLDPEMSVGGYLRFRAAIQRVPRKRRRAATQRAMERCGLEDVARRRIGTLSKGYRQRVGLAGALVHDPPILILDEPTSGLDPTNIASIRRLIRELAGDRTLLLVSHILPEVERTCDRVVVFARGRVRADIGTGDLIGSEEGAVVIEIPTDQESLARSALGELGSAVSAGEGPEGSLIVQTRGGVSEREAIAVALVGAGVRLRGLRSATPTLESLYLRVLDGAEGEDADP